MSPRTREKKMKMKSKTAVVGLGFVLVFGQGEDPRWQVSPGISASIVCLVL